MEERKLNVSFGKSGAGSISPRISLSVTDLRDMGVTPEEREIIYHYDKKNKEIIIKKAK